MRGLKRCSTWGLTSPLLQMRRRRRSQEILATLVVVALVVTLEVVLVFHGLASTSERGTAKGVRDRLGV
jgi:hypothetical protein